MEHMIQEINQVIANSHAQVSMLVKDIATSEVIFECNSKNQIISASTIKVPILLAILEEVRKGNATLEDQIFLTNADILPDSKVFEHGEVKCSVYELLHWMIIESDNTATNVLIKHFGMDQINAYIQSLGCQSTSLQRYMMDAEAVKNGFNNYTSQEDMAYLFTTLFRKEILTPQLCDTGIEILYRQRYQDMLLRYLYEPVKFAHKTGNLEHINHDVGVMMIHDRAYYVGVSIYDAEHVKGNKSLMGKLGKMIHTYLNRIV